MHIPLIKNLKQGQILPAIISISFYLFIFSALLHHSFKYMDYDFGWHLQVGQEIASSQSVPHIEKYDYTIKGRNWVDHEWLINLLSFFIYDQLGYIALNIFFALLITITLFILFQYAAPKNQIISMFLQFFGMLAMMPHLGVRMQEITIFFLLILLILLNRYQKTKNYKTLFFLPIIFYTWSCLHAGFLIGIAISIAWLGIKISETVLQNKKIKILSLFFTTDPLNKKELQIFSLFLFFTITATIFTPYGLELYNFLWSYSDTYYLTHIQEWLPINFFPFQYWQILYLSTASSLLILGLYYTIYLKKSEKIKIDIWQIFLFILLLLLSFKSRRHFPLFFIVTFSLMINISAYFFGEVPRFLKNKKYSTPIATLSSVILLLLAIILLLKTNYTNNPFQDPLLCKNLPCGSANYIKNDPKLMDLKIFNNYGWGGYLIRVWPGKELFIDGRLPQYQYNNHSLLEEYYSFFEEGNSEKMLNEHNIELVLVNKPRASKLNILDKCLFSLSENDFKSKEKYLIDYLQNSKNWKMEYEDKNSLIYTRNQN